MEGYYLRPKTIKKSKKGQIRDIAFVLVTLVSIAITLLVAGYIYNQIDDSFESSGIESNESAAAFDSFESAFGLFDAGYGFIIIGLTIGLIISAFFIPTHPIFLIINIFGFLVLIFMGAVFSNLYVDMGNQDGFNETLAYYPITSFIATKLPFIAAILVFLTSVVMYGKGQQT